MMKNIIGKLTKKHFTNQGVGMKLYQVMSGFKKPVRRAKTIIGIQRRFTFF